MNTKPTSRQRRTMRLGPILMGVAMVLAACSSAGGGSSSPSADPSGTPTEAPTPGPSPIDHATGALDVVFRFEQGGGFVPMGFFATQAPQFTLYGDGTVIFRDARVVVPDSGSIGRQSPYLIATLSEAEVQTFLKFALDESGLRTAGTSYSPGNVADAPTSIFTINAGGLSKVVSVDALGFDNPQSPDAAILGTLAVLGERIRNVADAIDGEVAWAPDRWRGILMPGPDNTGASMAWPWTDLAPADFEQTTDVLDSRFPLHTLTPAHVAALGLAGIDGGFASLALSGPDGQSYSLALRPILPDETH